MLFDWLILGQVLAINPAHAVRGRRGGWNGRPVI
jgi:hypothetical protein